MKIVAVGDTHGRSNWKIVAHTVEFDKMVFVGDYFDSFDIDGETQVKNFIDIIEFKEKFPEKVVLLLGNHDCHYLPSWRNIEEEYSGFQPYMKHHIGYYLLANMHHLQMAYMYSNHLFTHAGVTKTWLNSTMGLKPDEKVDFGVRIDEYINQVFKATPSHFWFNGNDGYGDDITQSPIWVRPQSLNEDATNHIHIVGHTGQKRIGTEPTYFREEGAGFFIDTLGTSGEYLIINDGKYEIGKL